MIVDYDRDADKLTIDLEPEPGTTGMYRAEHVTIFLDEDHRMRQLVISNASQFIARALGAGVKVEIPQAGHPTKSAMAWYAADSAMINAFGYDPSRGTLELVFNDGSVYRYYDVPETIFEELRAAESKGKYIRDHIINQYRTDRVAAPFPW